MSADIIMFRDYQQRRDIERAYEELNKQAIEIANIAFPSVFGVCGPCESRTLSISDLPDPSQANAFHAPNRDPA